MNAQHYANSPFAPAIAAFLAAGGQIEVGPSPACTPPKRSDKIDPDAVLKRNRCKPAPKPAADAAQQPPTIAALRGLAEVNHVHFRDGRTSRHSRKQLEAAA